MIRTVGRWLVIACCAAACTVGDGSENASSFGMSVGSFSSSASASASDTDVDDEDGGASSSSEEGSTTEEDPPDPGTTSTGAVSSDPTTGVTDTGGNGEQPENGMYSPCLMATECIGQNTCMTVNGTGFCTTTSCVDPLVDCDPSPGGTAVPVCYPTPDMSGDFLCALSCNAGETCPTPMTCHAGLADGAVCS